MKKLITLLLFLTQTITVVSQTFEEDCTAGSLVVLSGNLYDYQLDEDCTTSVKLTTLDQDTFISGVSLITPLEAVNILPIDGYKIHIKPEYGGDKIKIKTYLATIGDRDENNTPTSAKSSSQYIVINEDGESVSGFYISLYPNPVETELRIETNDTIISYKIDHSYGFTAVEESYPTSNTIQLTNLPSGIYYITIKTQNYTVRKSFIKY